MKKYIVLAVFGTRPEAVKMCPLIRELKSRENVECICCVTGQHRELLDSVLRVFNVVPEYDLNIMSTKQSLTDITTRCLTGFGEVLEKVKPDLVLVHGDTTTAFACSLAAFYRQIPVGHVEAGLRTGDLFAPYPEEGNRKMITAVSAYHFCPIPNNKENLRKEGICEGVFVTGNTVVDAIGSTVSDDYMFQTDSLRNIDFVGKKVITMTCHRRENYGRAMGEIMEAAVALVESDPELEIVYPMHPVAEIRELAGRLMKHARIHLIDPIAPDEMHNLIARSYLVMTDSGGLQEEAPARHIPVVLLRDKTERPEAIAAGTVILGGTKKSRIIGAVQSLLRDAEKYQLMCSAVSPYGDGAASQRIADAIEWIAGIRTSRPAEFEPGVEIR